MLSTIERWLGRLDSLLANLTALAMLGVMFAIVSDVVRRYVFDEPIAWIFDLVSIYFINMTLYLVASDTLRGRGHIALDLHVRLLPERWWRALQGVAWLAVAVVLAMTSWVVAASAVRSFIADEIRPGLYEWRVWLEIGVVAFGMMVLTARVVLRLADYAVRGMDATVFTADESGRLPDTQPYARAASGGRVVSPNPPRQ